MCPENQRENDSQRHDSSDLNCDGHLLRFLGTFCSLKVAARQVNSARVEVWVKTLRIEKETYFLEQISAHEPDQTGENEHDCEVEGGGAFPLLGTHRYSSLSE